MIGKNKKDGNKKDGNKKKSIKKIYMCMITLAALLLCFLIGPADWFVHGYFCDDEIEQDLAAVHITDYVQLGKKDFICKFTPKKKHFAGFEINLANQPEKNTGKLILKIYEVSDRLVEKIEADLSKIRQDQWYRLYAKKTLKQGETYKLAISAKSCHVVPYLKILEKAYTPSETISGNVLLGYAYQDPVFSESEKVLFCLGIVTAWGFFISFGIADPRITKKIRTAAAFLCVTLGLAWNYMSNFMDSQNTVFENFQFDSESLVSGPIAAQHHGFWRSEGYGLGRYSDIHGMYWKNGRGGAEAEYLTDENWTNGYANTQAAIVVPTSDYSRRVAEPGNNILFSNGSRLSISAVVVKDAYTNIYLDTDQILTEAEFGTIGDIRFYDADGSLLDAGVFVSYASQYGLQGKVFCHLAKYFPYTHVLEYLNLLCSLAAAAVFVLLVFLLYRKYNVLFAVCFFLTFLLSPWIVNFARNLYWVEFTWFLPMAGGLLCAWKMEEKKYRTAGYLVVFVSTAVKSLCGYEYISAVMLGAVVFPAADFMQALAQKDMQKGKQLLRMLFEIGMAAAAGFVVAVCIHAQVRGSGDILKGIADIYENDMRRRTNGADLNIFADIEIVKDSLNASVWEVFCTYFHFDTQIVTGLAGNLFPLLCMAPLFIFIYDYKNKILNVEHAAWYILFFLTAVSWFVLAKAHSYVHTHMNYVLWYFGFVQTCFYVILHKAAEMLKNKR